MRYIMHVLLTLFFYISPCFVHAQTSYHYFSLNELLELSMDNTEQVKNKLALKGYELYPSTNTARVFFSEPSNLLRTGSSITKFKDPTQKVFRVMDYKVALQSQEPVNWLRNLNTSIKNAGFVKASANDSASFHLSKDSTVQVLILVKKNSDNIQVATVSIFEPFNKVRNLRQFSVNEIETMVAGLQYFERTKFMTANAFLKHPSKFDSYYQTSATKEMLLVDWKDALAEEDREWLQLSFSTAYTYQKYLDQFSANGYQATTGQERLKKGNFVLTPDNRNWTLRLTKEAAVTGAAETPASFPGGKATWDRYLANSIDFDLPIRNGAPKGKYVVEVEFQITETGEIGLVFIRTKHGYGMEQELRRVIWASPHWTPAVKNGKNISSYLRQKITFAINED